MTLRTSLLLGALALSLALLFALVASAWSPSPPTLPPDRAQVQAALQRAPLLVIQNVGQFAPQARFQVRGGAGGGSLWLAEDALWLTLVRPPTPRPASQRGGRGLPAPWTGEGQGGGAGVHLKLSFIGANPQPRLEPFNRLETHVSYFIGNDPTKWHADVPVWGGVRYVGLYPGIDLEVGADLRGLPDLRGLRLVVHPGGEMGQVRLKVEGAEAVEVEGGWVRLDTAVGPVTLPPLLAEDDTLLQPILAEGAIAWARQPVDPLRPLRESVSVPGVPAILRYSTFLGGSGFDYGENIAVDGSGAAYVTGYTESTDFPTTPGAFDPSYNGYSDAFVTKLNAAGSQLVYSTFLGGSGIDYSYGIAVDVSGAAYVTGRTHSTDFPTTPGAFDPSLNGYSDAFVTKLNASGSQLEYSTFLGGSNGERGDNIAVDEAGVAYVTGTTDSSDFPTTPGAFDPTFNGGGQYPTDAFVTKLNATGSNLVYSTFLGGSSDECFFHICAIAVDGAGAAYVTGATSSSDFPVTPGAFDPTFNSGDAFVTKLNADGSGLVYSTFLGGSSNDYGQAIAVDGAGAAYVTGATSSSDFPVTPGAFDPTYNGSTDVFVTKLNADGSGLVYSTFLGGSSDECYSHFFTSNCDITVDSDGAAYVTGATSSSDFPVTPGAFDPTYNGSTDVFVTKLNADGSGLVYSTFLGGSSDECLFGDCAIAVDSTGSAYVMGVTYSSDFPITSGAFDPSFNGLGDVYVVKLDMIPYRMLYLPLIVNRR